MNKNLVIVLIIVAGVVCGEVQSCTSCGSECQSSCGTKFFRTCCFNYLKKRTIAEPMASTMDPSLRLELWLASARINPATAYFLQHAQQHPRAYYDYDGIVPTSRLQKIDNRNDNTNDLAQQ